MAKTIKLILFGVLPLAVGYVLNYVLLYLPASGWILCILEIGLLFLWGCLAYRVAAPSKNSALQAFWLCVFGLLMLALALYQELVLGHYWGNVIGIAVQMYFLPLLTLTSTALTPLGRLFLPAIRPWPFYIAIWICMFTVSCAGCLRKRKTLV